MKIGEVVYTDKADAGMAIITACAGTLTRLETAKKEVNRPFAQEQEYADKSARLKEVNILLNMDEKDRSILDAGLTRATWSPFARRSGDGSTEHAAQNL